MSPLEALIMLGVVYMAEWLIRVWHMYPRKRSVFS